MAKIIILEHEGQEYTLEFTRRTVAEMEQSGFKISDITEKPVSVLPEHSRHITDFSSVESLRKSMIPSEISRISL